MKKIFAFLSAFAMVIALAGCGSSAASEGSGSASASPTDEQVELIVFAAASMTETLEEIQKTYETENPNVKLIFTFDSSGTLKTQIAEAAPCDVFISAAPKQMNQLDITQDEEKNPDRLDFIDPDTRINLLENKVALVVPSNNPLDIKNFDDLAKKLKNEQILLAMGNSDVPVGQYTQKILAYYELNEEELANAGKITYGTNVKDVVEQVKNESVQAGVVYATDAASGGLTVIDTAKKEMCGQVIYPAAVLKESAHPEEARAFLAYLQNETAMKVFEGVGFSKAE